MTHAGRGHARFGPCFGHSKLEGGKRHYRGTRKRVEGQDTHALYRTRPCRREDGTFFYGRLSMPVRCERIYFCDMA